MKLQRVRIYADVLHVDEPSMRQFDGPQAMSVAWGYGCGLIDGNPDVLQVAFVGYDSDANAWRDLGTRCNTLYVGQAQAAP